MSSVLYAEVLSKDDRRVTFLLVALQQYWGADHYQFVESPTLAAQLIVEAWYEMVTGNVAGPEEARRGYGFLSARGLRTRPPGGPMPSRSAT